MAALFGIGWFLAQFSQWQWLGPQATLSGVIGTGFALAALLFAALMTLARIPSLQTPGIKAVYRWSWKQYGQLGWPSIVLIALLAGLAEEMLMRAGIQSNLNKWLPAELSIAITAVIFGLLHFINWVYVVAATAIGLFIGIVFHQTESLLCVMVLHTTYDILALGVIAKCPHWLNIDTQA